MAYSYVNYTGNGTTTVFSVPFSFIERANVKISLDEEIVTDVTWLSDASIRFPVAPPEGVGLRLQRITEKVTSVVDFQNGSVLKEDDLDLMVTQLLFIAQEAYDALDGETAVAAKNKAEKILIEIQELYGKTKTEIDGFRRMWIDVQASPTAPGRGEYDFDTGKLTLFIPAGPAGPQGPEGAEGAQGLPGATGQQGPQGVQGPQGKQGERGPEGAQGPQGMTGAQGPRGEVGLQGPAGPQGPEGPDGERGPQGPEGPKGAIGDKGPLGDSPLPLTFGSFSVNAKGYLQFEYAGGIVDSNTFTINPDTGMLEVNLT